MENTPTAVQLVIISFLSPSDLILLAMVSKLYYKQANDRDIWETLARNYFDKHLGKRTARALENKLHYFESKKIKKALLFSLFTERKKKQTNAVVQPPQEFVRYHEIMPSILVPIPYLITAYPTQSSIKRKFSLLRLFSCNTERLEDEEGEVKSPKITLETLIKTA